MISVERGSLARILKLKCQITHLTFLGVIIILIINIQNYSQDIQSQITFVMYKYNILLKYTQEQQINCQKRQNRSQPNHNQRNSQFKQAMT